jgi:hypothetical protein
LHFVLFQHIISEMEVETTQKLGRAMRAAHQVAARGGDEFVKAGDIVDVRFAAGQSMSLAARKLLALMILAAAGDAWQPVTHRLRKSDIRRGHKSNEHIPEQLEELHQTLFCVDDQSWRGKKSRRRFSLIASSIEEVDESSGTIEWRFTDEARQLLRDSESYAVLNRQAVLGFRSAYALSLYELGSLRLHRADNRFVCDVIGLRSALGISPDKYSDYAQIRRSILKPIKAELDQLAHFTVTWTEKKQGRKITEIAFTFHPKAAPQQLEAIEENEKHSAGRRARREGRTETVIDLAWPPDDRLGEFAGPTELYAIGVEHGNNHAVERLAASFVEFMGPRRFRIHGEALRKSWTGFVKTKADVWAPV